MTSLRNGSCDGRSRAECGARKQEGSAHRAAFGVAEPKLPAVAEAPGEEFTAGGDAEGVGVAEGELDPAPAREDGLGSHLA